MQWCYILQFHYGAIFLLSIKVDLLHDTFACILQSTSTYSVNSHKLKGGQICVPVLFLPIVYRKMATLLVFSPQTWQVFP